MVPVSYTETGNVIRFHYRLSDLRQFLLRGKQCGDVGMILLRKEGERLDYTGFGTIEHPFTWRAYISLIHNPELDGQWDIHKIMEPPPSISGPYSFVVIDANKKDWNEL
jgi:hypothetical protein